MVQLAPNTTRPEMAGKKKWDFAIQQGKESDIPATVRTGGMKLPFNFDAMKPGHWFNVPKEFWDERVEKGKNTPPANKDRIRRSFYNWQAADEKVRKKFALAFSDQFDAKQNYIGVNVYMANKPN